MQDFCTGHFILINHEQIDLVMYLDEALTLSIQMILFSVTLSMFFEHFSHYFLSGKFIDNIVESISCICINCVMFTVDPCACRDLMTR